MKANMVRELNARGVSVLAVPWDHDFDGVLDDYDGLFLSNGPGDPEQCAATIAELRKTLAREGDAVRPVFGICLGNQLTGLAAGAKTTKLRFGNRGQNQPVLDALHPGACMVTSQNHGFAVDDTDLPEGWRTLYTNANDGSNEGLVHASKPYFTAQFHPEANGGPTDAYYLFDVFVDACSRHKAGRVPGGAAPAASDGVEGATTGITFRPPHQFAQQSPSSSSAPADNRILHGQRHILTSMSTAHNQTQGGDPSV